MSHVSKYRIRAVVFAASTTEPWSSSHVHWRHGIEYRAYANTPRGIRRQVNAMIRDLADGHEVIEHTLLDAGNNPCDNLFTAGATASLDIGETERHRVTWSIRNPHSPWSHGRTFVHVEQGRWEH